MDLRIKKTHPLAIIPTRAKPGDSGLDLYACLPDGPMYLYVGGAQVISSGVAIELPARMEGDIWRIGYEGQVRPRSGMTKRLLLVPLGTIDNGYRGTIGVTVVNLSGGVAKINHGDRIAQLVVSPVVYPSVVVVDELSASERGEAGFGSTGV